VLEIITLSFVPLACPAKKCYNIYISKGEKVPRTMTATLTGAFTRTLPVHLMKGAIMALRRQKNNIINLALVIANADEKAGMTIDQTILNGKSAAVSFRLVNGGRKSAAVKLDRQACEDLLEAVTEILASEGDF